MSSTINTPAGPKPIDPYKAKSFENPPLTEKVEDLVKFMSEVKYGMLTTKLSSDSELLTSRCMALAGMENGGVDLIFHTNLFSGKTMDLTVHPQETNISFLDQISRAWASVSGTASIIADKEMVKKYYTPELRAWLGDLGDGVHDGGPNDPRIGLIKLEAKLATYMHPSKGAIGRAVDTMKGAATGETPSYNRLRELSQEELAEWRRTHKS